MTLQTSVVFPAPLQPARPITRMVSPIAGRRPVLPFRWAHHDDAGGTRAGPPPTVTLACARHTHGIGHRRSRSLRMPVVEDAMIPRVALAAFAALGFVVVPAAFA